MNRSPADETQPPGSDLAVTAAPSSAATQPMSPGSSWSGATRRERLVAGAMVGTRYRIVAALGRGGMGEVYRADDLELGQSVALKFLPDHLADDAVALDRLRKEVRTARQIGHPNVCRVYDIGNAGRDYFLTMEFVDGEDLASVLRRLGPPGKEKSLELSRQICAGLHAAHEAGVLHRDLKPANIMLDGRGRARITDFGLAGLAAELIGARERAGTPAYMAPEQLLRGEVSTRSDIYSLGLILLELFTGKSPNAGKSIEQLLQTQPRDTRATISSLATAVEPAVERVIEHCLAPDPKERPASAMSVVAALPGGDPIAAALAAGETPSPQLVAAAGSAGLIPIGLAAGLLGLVLFGLIVHVVLGPRTRLINRTPLPKPPEVLLDRARQLAADFGYAASGRGDSFHGFTSDGAQLRYLITHGEPPHRFAELEKASPSAIHFWYRQSPQALIPRTYFPVSEPISLNNPPLTSRGMVTIELAPDGTLLRFTAIPWLWDWDRLNAATQPAPTPATQHVDAGDATPFNFTSALSAAGFAPESISPVPAAYVPLTAFDQRAAWVGTFSASGRSARIEAASYDGKLTSFSVLAPWDQPGYRAPPQSEWRDAVGGLFQIIIFGGTGVLIAVNFAQRRGDPRGAMKVAMFVGIINLLTWLLAAARLAGPPGPWFMLFLQAFAFSLLLGSLAWSLYMGLEPYIRRRSPYRLVSWSRLLEGRFRDPLVGRDLLFGLALGTGAVAAVYVVGEVMALFMPRSAPSAGGVGDLASLRPTIQAISGHFLNAITGAMMFLIMPLILQIVLRSWYAAIAVFWLFIAAFVGSPGVEFTATNLIGAAISWAACLFALYRFGVVAGAAAIFAVNVLGVSAPAANWSAWYAAPGLVTTAVIATLAGWGFYLALGGRSIVTAESLVRA